MSDNEIKSERGQNLVIIAILMVVFIAMAALVIDGGFSLSKRREAQNAADAGALAGAAELCSNNPDQAEPRAIEYAITRNHAGDATVDVGEKAITVTTVITHETFLAGIIGSDVVTITAEASAGCFSPCASTGVMPVAWACRDPSQGGEDQESCAIQYGTVDEPGPIYVIMDSNKAEADYQCQDPITHLPAGYLDCDIYPPDPYNDGVNDLMSGGGRSWLDLDGGSSGSSDLVDWIRDGFSGVITDHLWLPGTDGTAADIFGAAVLRTGDMVILPVFNDYTVACRPDIDAGCMSQWHAVDQIRPSSGASTDYYHIISFSVFKITCVSKVPGQHCDTKDYLVSNNIIEHQDKTIEGYFVTGYIPGLEGICDFDAGAYTIFLKP